MTLLQTCHGLAALAGLLALAACTTPPAAGPSAGGPGRAAAQALMDRLAKASPDWDQASRYRDQDRALPPPAPGAPRVVFMGDSITEGWAAGGHFFAGLPVVGRGISGQTTPQMLGRFGQDVLALRPATVVILAGTNDIAGNTGPYDPEATRGCIGEMVAQARAAGARVILCSVLPAHAYPWRPGIRPGAPIAELNIWIQGLAAATGSPFVDFFPVLSDDTGGMRPEYSADGVHPNAAGYAVMEGVLRPFIDPAAH